MTKNIFIFLVLVLFIGGAVYLFMKKSDEVQNPTANVMESTSPTPGASASVTPAGQSGWVQLEGGLKYMDEVVGTGNEARPGTIVQVHYTGTLENGSKFDSSVDRGKPFAFALGAGQVIRGWDLGVAGMKVGGKRKLYIPAPLAYGDRSPSPAIPAGSTLLFDVELLDVQTVQPQ